MIDEIRVKIKSDTIEQLCQYHRDWAKREGADNVPHTFDGVIRHILEVNNNLLSIEMVSECPTCNANAKGDMIRIAKPTIYMFECSNCNCVWSQCVDDNGVLGNKNILDIIKTGE